MFASKTVDKPICSICNKVSKTKFLESGEYTYYTCKSCGGIFVFPVKSQEFYLGTETYLSDPKHYTSNINPAGQRWIIEQFERLYKEKMKVTEFIQHQLLEIGAGVGFLSLFAYARGWEVLGIETSSAAVQFANDYLKVPLLHKTIEDLDVDMKFNAIAMVEVLEHFLDPIKAIEAMCKFSKKATFIFGTTPNTDSLHWKKTEQNIYVPDDHIFLFNERSITKLARKVGLKDLTVEFFGGGANHDSNLMYAGVISG